MVFIFFFKNFFVDPFNSIFGFPRISLDITIESFKGDWDYLENRILADIASSIWGKDYYYNILLNEDRQFLTSLEHVQEAKALVY